MVLPRRKYYKRLQFRERVQEKLPKKDRKLTFDSERKAHQVIPSSYSFPTAVGSQIPLQFPTLFPFPPFQSPMLPDKPCAFPQIPVINCDDISRQIDYEEEISIPKPLSFFSHIYQGNFDSSTESLNDADLVSMRGPSRLIGFLVTIAMNDRSGRALRWTGNGLEFILVDRDLVAKMWGNRKHNTKDMDYLKLSRAIREKYEKRTESGEVVKIGKLKKGSKIYSYVFTEHAHADLIKHTDKTIPQIIAYAARIGEKYREFEQPPVPDTPTLESGDM